MLALTLALLPAALCAQPSAPITGSTLKATSSAVDALCVGCPATTQVPAANSGAKIATITLSDFAAPTVTTYKLYQVAGGLYWNGVSVATGSTVVGTSGKIGKFTGVAAIGDSLLSESGSTVTMAGTLAATLFSGPVSGSCALCTAMPTTGITGNFVATVASGTGITSSVTTGNAAATTITLNNTAVTPTTYGSTTAIPIFTVDQQGRITAASNAGAGVALLASTNTFTATEQTLTVNANAATSWRVINTNAGAAAATNLFMDNDARASNLTLRSYSSGWATSLPDVADSVLLRSTGAGGTTIAAQNGAGIIRFVLGTTLRASYDSSGNYTFGSAGNITDAIATPTIASGFGTSPAIAGKDFAFVITIGTGGSASGVVNFNATYANAPICTANPDGALSGYWLSTSSSTTQVTVASNTTMIVNTHVNVLCRGY